jgi:Mn-dependent DtxR family transcriptional regulator
MQLQESGEMYLEAIFVLKNKNGQVRSIDIANYTGYTKPSVSRAMSILKDNKYIEIDGLGYITLTESGEETAKRIYERHTLLTKFLIKLGVDERTAAEDACKIEHYISAETFDKIKVHAEKIIKQKRTPL